MNKTGNTRGVWFRIDSRTEVMLVGGANEHSQILPTKGVLVRVVETDWVADGVTRTCTALTFVPGATLADFGLK